MEDEGACCPFSDNTYSLVYTNASSLPMANILLRKTRDTLILINVSETSLNYFLLWRTLPGICKNYQPQKNY